MHKWEGGAWKQVKEAQMKRTEWTFGRTLKRKGTGTSISLPTKYRTLLNTPYLQPLLAPFSRCYHSCRWSNALKGLRLENCTLKIQPGISGTRVLPLDPERAVRLQKACQAEPWEQSYCPATGQPNQAPEVPHLMLKAKPFASSLSDTIWDGDSKPPEKPIPHTWDPLWGSAKPHLWAQKSAHAWSLEVGSASVLAPSSDRPL